MTARTNVVLGVILPVAITTACSGDEPNAASAEPEKTGHADDVASVESAGNDGGQDASDACALLTEADVAAVLGSVAGSNGTEDFGQSQRDWRSQSEGDGPGGGARFSRRSVQMVEFPAGDRSCDLQIVDVVDGLGGPDKAQVAAELLAASVRGRMA